MAYRIDIDPAAVRDLAKLPRDVLPRIDRAIMRLAEDPRPRGAIKLKNSSDEWRIRVGSYRVVYEIHDDRLVVRVIRAAHRREAY